MRNEAIDAWLFLAVAYGRGDNRRAALTDLIGAADWINHAIPLDEELRAGLNRLVAAGLVNVDDDAFGLTDSGRSLLEKVSERAGLWKQWERLEGAFASLEDPPTPNWMPAEGEITRAIGASQRRARKIIESLASRR